ncbi:unnamed protein product [Durusdinium trenchii]|uniref:Uncharacterized protein n=2 Tax=Durusdinium trenchii TaxID=1381693 RepID=A0ABP0KKX8_9DINO
MVLGKTKSAENDQTRTIAEAGTSDTGQLLQSPISQRWRPHQAQRSRSTWLCFFLPGGRTGRSPYFNTLRSGRLPSALELFDYPRHSSGVAIFDDVCLARSTW